ncbi:hypothetical protein [Iningainema tapete]|uniref:Uncharacterized protein n=1 Tax=Iningainema tapete BLCC-T55 TaxID=2748662 RepID=A0A8J7BXK5_9CYAN|nr:hypothetical protein [Iningainema tapete]MBD2773957.1 hypothetical protein [Iningainema tapete BLCC-T55]
MASETVQFEMPSSDVITIKLVEHGSGGVTMEPVSGNPNSIHHHAFEDRNENWNILIRDQYDLILDLTSANANFTLERQ